MKKVEDYIRTIPDFPEPGIMFRDVTSVLEDAEGYVILDVALTLNHYGSYSNYVGMRHVTAEEITAAGGNLNAIYQ